MQAQDSRPATRLTALYEAHAADVFRFAMHLTGSREDAEDVVQFVFLRAYAALEEGTELMHPRAWLMKAAKHRSLNTIRDRREAPMAGSDLPLAPRHDPDPSEAAALAAVRSTLWALPEGQHQAFVLRHWSGLSQDEIADVLDTTPSAVESLLIRARRALVEDQQGAATECSRVRSRLVQALIPSSGQQAHITSCRRCRTAQSRLLRVSEFATAYALVPRPWVAHTLSSAIPGFGSSAAVTATATAATGGGAGVTAASAATKTALLAKVTLATATAVVALGATHPVRSALADAIAGRPAAPKTHRLAITHAPAPTTARPLQRATEGAQAASVSGKASGKSATAGSNGNGVGGGTHGKSATAGSNGNGGGSSGTHGKSATAGGNGNGGGNGTANGKSATAGGNGNASGKGVSAGDNGNASRNGKGKPTS